jgi:thiol-disulfide isomerase/thioredoxin
MDPVGISAVAAVLVVGVAGGLWRRRTSGRLRDVAPASASVVAPAGVGVVPPAGASVVAPAGASVVAPAGAGVEAVGGSGPAQGEPVDNDRKMSDPAGLLAPTRNGVGMLDPRMLTGLGVEPGEGVTLLQFSSAYCAPCRAVSRLSSEVAGEVPGVRHVEVDAEQHLDAVRELGIWRTPTLLVLDRAGRVVKRAAGVPQKPQLIAAVRETL